MYSSPFMSGRNANDSSMFSSPMQQSANDSVFGTPASEEPNRNDFLFGKKRRSLAVSGTPGFVNSPAATINAPTNDIFTSPTPAASSIPPHLKDSTTASPSGGKSVHWSPVLVKEKNSRIAPSPIIKSGSVAPPTFASPSMNGPPLRSLRDEIEPVKKAVRRSMSMPLNHPLNQSGARPASRAREVNAPPSSQSNQSSQQEASEPEADTWVTVFGFPPEQAANVLKYFSRHGEVVSHQVPMRGNWMHIRYSCGIHARQALSRNGNILDGCIRIGVVPCTEKELTGCDMSQSSHFNRSIMDQSIAEEPEDTIPALSSRDQNTSVLDTSLNQSRLSIASRTGMRSLSSAYETRQANKVVEPVKQDSIMNKLWTAVGL